MEDSFFNFSERVFERIKNVGFSLPSEFGFARAAIDHFPRCVTIYYGFTLEGLNDKPLVDNACRAD